MSHIASRRKIAQIVGCIGIGLFASLVWQMGVSADQITLQDGTELSGKVVGKDGKSVIIQLRRQDVTAINGRALPPPLTVGVVAPSFRAVDLTGAVHTLPDDEGRVTLLQFWATWCPHCRADIPLMKRLFATYRDKGLRLITVSVDQRLADLQAFIRREGLDVPVISTADPSNPAASLPDLYEIPGIPAYYVVDTKGLIAETFSGAETETHADLEGLLQQLLATPTTSPTPSP